MCKIFFSRNRKSCPTIQRVYWVQIKSITIQNPDYLISRSFRVIIDPNEKATASGENKGF